MLNARDASCAQPNGGIYPWDDIFSSSELVVSSRAPRNSTSHIDGNEPLKINAVRALSRIQTPSSETSGLRSRRVGSHRRVVTTDSSLSSHPLQSPSISASSSILDGAITRPSLRRRLGSESDFNGSEQDSFEGDIGSIPRQPPREAEVMVIVHEVKGTDSVAGVALKYGITLSDLRKANHLWASDSIHLRKVIYVPLHLSSRKYHYYTINGQDEDASLVESEANEASSCSTRSSVVIQRVPASQLAFFPPPSQASLSSHSERKGYSTTPSPPRISPEPNVSGTLSSLFQTLALPTRDMLFPRLSADSGETLSTGNVSETSSEPEHEMDILGQSRSRRVAGSGRRIHTTHRNSAASIETLRKEDPYATPLMPLQTEQLQPSPQMELPRLSKATKGKRDERSVSESSSFVERSHL